MSDLGWAFPPGSRKAHYFTKDGRSLCNRYGFRVAEGEPDDGKASPDDCRVCRRTFEKRSEATS